MSVKFSMRFKLNQDLIIAKTRAGTEQRLGKIGSLIESNAKQIAGTGGGSVPNPPSTPEARKDANIYYHSFLRRWVQGSKPGEPPRAQTSGLIQSIRHEVDMASLSVRIGPSVKYGKFLEFGTRKMAARPFMRPALKQATDKLINLFERLF